MKKALLALAVAGAAVSAQADVKLSGHVNTSFGDIEEFQQSSAGANTGETDLSVNNATTSQSRFRVVSTKEHNGITYGTNLEVGFAEANTLSVRKNELWFSGDFGKVSIGQGSDAADGVTESSFSSTWVTWNDISNYEAGYGGAGDEFGTYEWIDGGRTDRIRYDSPKVGGIATFSADIQDDDDSALSVRLSNSNFQAGLYHLSKDASSADEFGGSIALKAGIFVASYHFSDRDSNGNTTDNSAAIIAGTGAAGANQTVAFSDVSSAEAEFRAFNIGVETANYGLTLDFQKNELIGTIDADEAREVSTVGLNFTYRPAGGVTLYANIRKIEADITSANAQALGNNNISGNGAIAGARITF